MKSSAIALTTLMVFAGPAAAEIVDIEWTSDGRFVHRGAVAAGKFVEVCGKLPVGLKVGWEFETASPVDFNVHYHEGKAVIFPAQLSAVTHAKELLDVKSEQDYCWKWTNKASSPTTLVVALQR